MRSMLAACLARSAGEWKVGRTAIINSRLPRDGGEGGGGAPGVEGVGLGALDVVEIELSDEGEVVAEVFGTGG